MDKILGPFFGTLKRRYDAGDMVDRLNYQYTTLIMIVASLTLIGKQYVGQPLQCWVPAQFTGAWESYTETYCYIKNTYYLPLNRQIPHQFGQRDNKEIGYYQWVPIVLAFQAILFWFPAIFWRILNWQSGVHVKSILNAAANVKKKLDSTTRQNEVQVASTHLKEALEMQRHLKVSSNICGPMFYGKHHGCFVSGLYLFTKLLYILNVVAQFFILNSFLGPQYTLWGYGILRDLANGVSWEESGHFPRVTMCDFQVRVLGNLHRWTVQCVLMINMFNEKIYIFLWWWFVIVALLSILSALYWFFACCLKTQRQNFVEKYLRVEGCIARNPGIKEERMIDGFVNKHLRPDGVFMMRMIQGNGGDLLTGEIVKCMWENYIKTEDKDEVDKEISNGFNETPT